MAWYPFDIQTCHIEMLLDGVLDNYADLLSAGVNFTGPTELTQYFVQNYKIGNKSIKTKSAVVVSMTLGRRLLGTFLTIFFPTILLNLIGYSTNYFKAFFFEVTTQVSI
jgi:hypothetical protein